LLRGLRQEGMVVQLVKLLLLQLVQVSSAGIAVAVVERTEVNSDVGQGAGEIVRGQLRLWGRPRLRRSPVCSGRSAAGSASRRHVCGS
jgi:hypothetical protein